MIALITARGGSKGLPFKNIKPLNGKPLIAWTIEAAAQARHIDRIILSTDSDDIAETAVKYGAEIPFMRPDYLATDNATSLEVFKYTISRLEKQENIVIENFMVLQPTSPLRTAIHIDEAAEIFFNKKAKAVVGYCKEAHPVFWHKRIGADGKIKNLFKENYMKNRQEIPTSYYPNGAIFIFDKEYIFSTKDYSENCYPYLMSAQASVDIDTLEDFEYAEFLIKKQLTA